jgi:hypothetical protein
MKRKTIGQLDAASRAKMYKGHAAQNKLIGRLPVRPGIEVCAYHRPPTKGEIKFGYGATHYADFSIEECCHPGTRVLKRWFKSSYDGLRYYR